MNPHKIHTGAEVKQLMQLAYQRATKEQLRRALMSDDDDERLKILRTADCMKLAIKHLNIAIDGDT